MTDRAPPFPDSLCHRCAALRVVAAARSSFLFCAAGHERYPRQPIVSCALFRPLPPAAIPGDR